MALRESSKKADELSDWKQSVKVLKDSLLLTEFTKDSELLKLSIALRFGRGYRLARRFSEEKIPSLILSRMKKISKDEPEELKTVSRYALRTMMANSLPISIESPYYRTVSDTMSRITEFASRWTCQKKCTAYIAMFFTDDCKMDIMVAYTFETGITRYVYCCPEYAVASADAKCVTKTAESDAKCLMDTDGMALVWATNAVSSQRDPLSVRLRLNEPFPSPGTCPGAGGDEFPDPSHAWNSEIDCGKDGLSQHGALVHDSVCGEDGSAFMAFIPANCIGTLYVSSVRPVSAFEARLRADDCSAFPTNLSVVSVWASRDITAEHASEGFEVSSRELDEEGWSLRICDGGSPVVHGELYGTSSVMTGRVSMAGKLMDIVLERVNENTGSSRSMSTDEESGVLEETPEAGGGGACLYNMRSAKLSYDVDQEAFQLSRTATSISGYIVGVFSTNISAHVSSVYVSGWTLTQPRTVSVSMTISFDCDGDAVVDADGFISNKFGKGLERAKTRFTYTGCAGCDYTIPCGEKRMYSFTADVTGESVFAYFLFNLTTDYGSYGISFSIMKDPSSRAGHARDADDDNIAVEVTPITGTTLLIIMGCGIGALVLFGAILLEILYRSRRYHNYYSTVWR